MAYLFCEVYAWRSGGRNDSMDIWTHADSPLTSGEFDPVFKAGVRVPMPLFDQIVAQRARELGWRPPA